MADKRLIYVKGHCETCRMPVGVEVPEPESIVRTVKEPCKCGIDSESRTAKYIATGIATGVVALFLALSGSCISNHYFSTQQVKVMKGNYLIQEQGKDYHTGENPFDIQPFRVVPKPEPRPEPKKEEMK